MMPSFTLGETFKTKNQKKHQPATEAG